MYEEVNIRGRHHAILESSFQQTGCVIMLFLLLMAMLSCSSVNGCTSTCTGRGEPATTPWSRLRPPRCRPPPPRPTRRRRSATSSTCLQGKPSVLLGRPPTRSGRRRNESQLPVVKVPTYSVLMGPPSPRLRRRGEPDVRYLSSLPRPPTLSPVSEANVTSKKFAVTKALLR